MHSWISNHLIASPNRIICLAYQYKVDFFLLTKMNQLSRSSNSLKFQNFASWLHSNFYALCIFFNAISGKNTDEIFLLLLCHHFCALLILFLINWNQTFFFIFARLFELVPTGVHTIEKTICYSTLDGFRGTYWESSNGVSKDHLYFTHILISFLVYLVVLFFMDISCQMNFDDPSLVHILLLISFLTHGDFWNWEEQ